MKIGQLRKLLKDNDKKLMVALNKFITGESFQVKKLKLLIKKFDNEKEDYELKPLEVYDLIKIINHDNLEIFQKIRDLLNYNYFFPVYNLLNSERYMNDHIFTDLYNLSGDGRYLLLELFNGKPEERIPLNEETLTTVLTLYEHSHSSTLIKKMIILFNKNKLLDSYSWGWLKDNFDFFWLLHGLLESVALHSILDKKSLAIINGSQNSFISDTLILLKKNNIQVGYELLSEICLSKNLLTITPILKQITSIANSCLDEKNFKLILSKRLDGLFDIKEIYNILEENHILNLNTIPLVPSLDYYQIRSIIDISRLLALNGILTEQLFIRLIKEKYNKDALLNTVSYLNKCKLLTLFIADIFDLIISDSSNPLFIILNTLSKKTVYISKCDLDILLKLSRNNIEKIKLLINDLANTNLLTTDSLHSIINRVICKIPSVEESNFNKLSRKQSGLSRSEIIINENLHLFMEHGRNVKKGGFGKVKRGFVSSTDENPIYAIKKLLSPRFIRTEKEAKREVRFNRLLNRETYFYAHKSHHYIVGNWYKEKALYEFDEKYLSTVSVINRIKWIHSGLIDLNKLHQHFCVHGDIKSLNFILNPAENILTLIDFGSARKYGSKKTFAKTLAYCEFFIHSPAYGFCDDIFAMGIVIANIFPELFSVGICDDKMVVEPTKSKNLDIYQQSVIELVNSMTMSDRGLRCTSQDALNFCDKILDNDFKSNANLTSTIAATLKRTKTEVEDVLRGAYRY